MCYRQNRFKRKYYTADKTEIQTLDCWSGALYEFIFVRNHNILNYIGID